MRDISIPFLTLNFTKTLIDIILPDNPSNYIIVEQSHYLEETLEVSLTSFSWQSQLISSKALGSFLLCWWNGFAKNLLGETLHFFACHSWTVWSWFTIPDRFVSMVFFIRKNEPFSLLTCFPKLSTIIKKYSRFRWKARFRCDWKTYSQSFIWKARQSSTTIYKSHYPLTFLSLVFFFSNIKMQVE